MPFPTHREKFPTAEAPKRGTHVPRRLLCSRYGAMQLQRVPSCHQSVGFTFCPCSGLFPLPPGSRRRALACPASLPRPVRLPASPCRTFSGPSRFRHETARPSDSPQTTQAAACPPFLAPFRRSRPACPSLSVNAPLSPVCAHGPAATPSFFCSGRREGNISVVPDGGLLYSPLLSIS